VERGGRLNREDAKNAKPSRDGPLFALLASSWFTLLYLFASSSG